MDNSITSGAIMDTSGSAVVSLSVNPAPYIEPSLKIDESMPDVIGGLISFISKFFM